ncbi:MAG TPA: hypothetical protein VFH85_03945 [Gammaproteobacteria bacterium]|nr:hypothetical protein [Gammaproteobacteria bacterium]
MFKKTGFGKSIVALALAIVATGAFAGSFHDPMRPDYGVTHSSRTSHSWHLSSILVAPHRRLAMINGESVSVGDRVDGATVAAILPGVVKLRKAGRVITIELIPTTIKTAHSASERRH